MQELDKTINILFAQLDNKLETDGKRDAIDEILLASPRETAVASLANHEAVKQFRQEATDGFVRVDTARRLLTLIQVAVEVAIA